MKTSGPQRCDLLIRNAFLITVDADRRLFPAGALAIDGNAIVDVGREQDVTPRWQAHRTIDADGAAVHPGLIDTHYHPMGMGARMVLSDAPVSGAEPAEATKTRYLAWLNETRDADEHAATLLSCAEMLRNGYTCFLEPGTFLNNDAAAAAMQAVGIRGSLAAGWLWDREGIHLSGFARAPVAAERAHRELGSQLWRNSDPAALVRGHVAVWGLGACSDDLVQSASALARERGVVFTMHQSMAADDARFDYERLGRQPLVHWANRGVLGPHCLFAHMNILCDDEIEPVVSSGMSIAWIPGNVMYWATGGRTPGRMVELHEKSVNLSLGVDMAKAWVFGDVPLIAYLLARMQDEYLPVEAIFEMSTLNGARAIGMDDIIGSLEVGKRADVVIRTRSLPEAYPGDHPLAQIMLSARSKSVDIVIVDGQIVVERGGLTRMDESEIFARATESAAAWAARAGLTLWRSPWPTES